eukprot:926215-Rhodomonas_salina.2
MHSLCGARLGRVRLRLPKGVGPLHSEVDTQRQPVEAVRCRSGPCGREHVGVILRAESCLVDGDKAHAEALAVFSHRGGPAEGAQRLCAARVDLCRSTLVQ